MLPDQIAPWFGNNQPNQSTVFLVALEIFVTEADNIAPMHQVVEPDRGCIEDDPDIGSPCFRLGNVDQDSLGRGFGAGHAIELIDERQFDGAPASGIEEESAEVRVQFTGTGTYLDRSLMDRSGAKGSGQSPGSVRHAGFAEKGNERGIIVSGQLIRIDRAGDQSLLNGTEEHRHAGPIRVVPVDVIEHFLASVDQAVQGADALVAHANPRGAVNLSNAKRSDQALIVNTPIWHATSRSITGQVIEFVDIERAGKCPAQQSVDGREILVAWIDEAGDSIRIDRPLPLEDRSDLIPQNDAPTHRLVGEDRWPEFFNRVGIRVVADVVQERRGR